MPDSLPEANADDAKKYRATMTDIQKAIAKATGGAK